MKPPQPTRSRIATPPTTTLPAPCRIGARGRKEPVILLLLAFGLLLGPSAAHAQLDEIWFDGPLMAQPGTNPEAPAVAVDGLARTVVAWQVNTNSGDIYVRRLDRDGAPVEDPIAVNDPVGPPQSDPAVAAAANGSFLVLWIQNDIVSTRGMNVFTIRSRHFDANGTPTGPERAVNQAGLVPSFSGGAHRPAVAALEGGGFVAVWRSATTAGSDANVSIQGRLLDSSGVPTGSQFQVNTTTSGSQDHPAVAPLPIVPGDFSGGFVAGWTVPDLHLRRFRANGTSPENDVQVDGALDGERLALSVNGWTRQVGVTWYEASEVRVRLFDLGLTPQGGTLVANSMADTGADNPVVADVGPDGFLLFWDTSTSVGNDNDLSSIQGRILLANGSFSGGQFQANTFIESNQTDPSVGSAAGRLSVAWRSLGNAEETNTTSIVGSLLDYCLFCDDFELGDTSRWSAVFP